VLVFVLGGGAGSLPLSLSLSPLPFLLFCLLYIVYLCVKVVTSSVCLYGKKVRTVVLNKMERESPRKKRDVAC